MYYVLLLGKIRNTNYYWQYKIEQTKEKNFEQKQEVRKTLKLTIQA